MIVPQTEIIVSKGGAELLRRSVPPSEYVIGRGEDCDLQIVTELISRKHAALEALKKSLLHQAFTGEL